MDRKLKRFIRRGKIENWYVGFTVTDLETGNKLDCENRGAQCRLTINGQRVPDPQMARDVFQFIYNRKKFLDSHPLIANHCHAKRIERRYNQKQR